MFYAYSLVQEPHQLLKINKSTSCFECHLAQILKHWLLQYFCAESACITRRIDIMFEQKLIKKIPMRKRIENALLTPLLFLFCFKPPWGPVSTNPDIFAVLKCFRGPDSCGNHSGKSKRHGFISEKSRFRLKNICGFKNIQIYDWIPLCKVYCSWSIDELVHLSSNCCLFVRSVKIFLKLHWISIGLENKYFFNFPCFSNKRINVHQEVVTVFFALFRR